MSGYCYSVACGLGLLFFPPIGTLVVYGGAYAAARAVAGGQPLSKVTKKVLKWGAVFVLGVGYDMSLTKFLEWSPQTLWTSLPVWCRCLLAERKDKRCSGHSMEKKRSGVGVVTWRAVAPCVRPLSE